MRYLSAMLAVICLLGAALLALFPAVTSEGFMARVNDSADVREMQQGRIDQAAATLTETWQISAPILAAWTEEAAAHQAAKMAAWWGDLWRDDGADISLPAWLDSNREAALVAEIRQDAGFIAATDADMRRAIARDEVAFALDEAVCEAVTPLRCSILELALSLAAERVSLTLLRWADIGGAAVLAVLAAAFLGAAHKAAGSALIATALTMTAVSVPVWMLDIPGQLAGLNAIAGLQGQRAMALLGTMWYGTAAMLALAGAAIILAKKRSRRNAA